MVLKIALSLIVLFLLIILDAIDYMLHSSASNGSKDSNNPTAVSAGQKIELKVSNQRRSSFVKYYCWWDNNEEEKITFDKGIFSSTATIEAPTTKGQHTLTITLKCATTYKLYYIVE